MRSWGVICQIERGDAIVVGVLAEGTSAAATLRPIFSHATDSRDDWAQKLRLLAAHLDTELRKAAPDILVLRTMDWTQRRKETPTRQRYHVEGAVLAAARQRVERVTVHNGREIGLLVGPGKAAVDADAAQLVAGALAPGDKHLAAKFGEAGAAALAGLAEG